MLRWCGFEVDSQFLGTVSSVPLQLSPSAIWRKGSLSRILNPFLGRDGQLVADDHLVDAIDGRALDYFGFGLGLDILALLV